MFSVQHISATNTINSQTTSSLMTYSIKVLNWQKKLNIKLLLLCHWKFSTSHLIDFRFKPDITTCNYFRSIWAPQQADVKENLFFCLFQMSVYLLHLKTWRSFRLFFFWETRFSSFQPDVHVAHAVNSVTPRVLVSGSVSSLHQFALRSINLSPVIKTLF